MVAIQAQKHQRNFGKLLLWLSFATPEQNKFRPLTLANPPSYACSLEDFERNSSEHISQQVEQR